MSGGTNVRVVVVDDHQPFRAVVRDVVAAIPAFTSRLHGGRRGCLPLEMRRRAACMSSGRRTVGPERERCEAVAPIVVAARSPVRSVTPRRWCPALRFVDVRPPTGFGKVRCGDDAAVLRS
jgi:hypothetical protein